MRKSRKMDMVDTCLPVAITIRRATLMVAEAWAILEDARTREAIKPAVEKLKQAVALLEGPMGFVPNEKRDRLSLLCNNMRGLANG